MGGGGADAPPDVETGNQTAVYVDTSWDNMVTDFATKPVGTLKPNSLGLYDMAGNVSEWVTDTGDEHVARGGNFDGPREELGIGRHIENQDDWNRDYPNEPKSIWWFVNARWVGLRVVREVSSE